MGNGGIAMAAELFHGSALRWGECIKRWPIAYWAGVFTGIAVMAVTFVVVIALAHHTPVFKLWYEWQIHSLENPDIQFNFGWFYIAVVSLNLCFNLYFVGR